MNKIYYSTLNIFAQHIVSTEWTRMTMIPHEAHQLSIHITTPVPLHVALRERKRDKPVLELSRHSKRPKQHGYLKYDPNVPQNLQIIDVDSHVIDIKEETEGQVRFLYCFQVSQETESNLPIHTLVDRLLLNKSLPTKEICQCVFNSFTTINNPPAKRGDLSKTEEGFAVWQWT